MESALDLDLFFSMFGGLLFRINVFFVAASFCFFRFDICRWVEALKTAPRANRSNRFCRANGRYRSPRAYGARGETSRDLMFGLRPVLLLETAGETSLDLRSEDCVDAL